MERGVRPIGFWSTWITLSHWPTPSTRVCLPGTMRAPLSLSASTGVQNLIDQSGFTGTRNTRHASEYSQWEVDRQILQIVFAGSNHAQLLGLTYFATGLRDLDLSAAGNVVARNRTRSVNELFRGTGIDHFAAMLASSRSDVNNPISVFDSVFVMLHNDQRVAKIAQMMQSGDQPLIVTLVQTDGWFVEHIHHAHQTGTDLGRQTNTLRLAARQGFAARDSVR